MHADFCCCADCIRGTTIDEVVERVRLGYVEIGEDVPDQATLEAEAFIVIDCVL